MALRDTMTRLFGAKASIIGLGADEIPGRPLEKGWDDGVILSTYGDDAWPYICASKIAQQGTQAPLRFGTLTGDGEFKAVRPDHPVQQLFDTPNPMMDGSEFLELLLIYSEMVGHAPIEVIGKVSNGRIGRQPAELWPVNPTHWRIVANPDATIKGYLWLKTSASDVRWTPEQMAYYRLPNPNDRWYGQGRIAAVRQPVMAEEYAAIRDKKFEQRMGVPPGILSSEMPLGEPQAVELQKRWEQAVGGYRNAGKIAVLGSKTTYQSVALNARDAQWIEQRRWRVQEISAAFEVPLVLVLMSEATFANAEEARAEFWEGKLAPTLNRLARWITIRLLPLITDEQLVARFDYSEVDALNDNEDEVAKRAVQWADAGSVQVNEVRKLIGLPPLPPEIGDRLLIPSSLTLKSTEEVVANAEMGMAGAEAALEAAQNPEPPDNSVPTGNGNGAEPDDDEPPVRKASKAATPPDRVTILAPVIAAYNRDLSAFFSAQAAALHTEKGVKADESLIERMTRILTAQRWHDRLVRISRAPIETALTMGATEAATRLAVDVSFSIPASEAALAQVTTHLDRLAVGIENTTVKGVREVIEQSLRDGVDNATTRARLDTLFEEDYKNWRLDRISRTETQAAYNLGSVGQYRDVGVAQVDVSDGDLDERCANANGRRWSLADAEADPLGHPNCTRVFIPVTEDVELIF